MKKDKKKITVTIDGKEYPIRLTMGAILRFKQETGKEVNEAEGTMDNATLVWCCIQSGCKREDKDFEYSLMDFADHVDADEIEGLVGAVFQLFGGDQQQDGEGDEAKNAV